LQLIAPASSTAAVNGSLAVVNLGSGSMSFTVTSSTQSGGSWLSLTPSSGTAPATVTVTANPSGLAVGTYLGTIVITPATSANPLNASQTVVVSLVVGAPAIFPGGIVDAASFSPDGSAASGELMSLFGTNLAVATNSAASLPLPTQLSGTQVLVNGTAAPLFFVSAGQINFELPAVTGGVATVAVATGGLTSSPAMQLSLLAAHPGIFVVGGGQNLGQILNANSSANSPANPATAGQTIQIFATGLGLTNPTLTPGQGGNAVAPFNNTVIVPTVTIGGINATVSFSAAAPNLAGVYQVNAVVPAGLPSGGFVAVQISAGGKSSNTVMLAVH
jgi:adhesin/invasin